jgi:hypothetical protein
MNLDEAAAIRNSLTFQLPKLGGDPLRFFLQIPMYRASAHCCMDWGENAAMTAYLNVLMRRPKFRDAWGCKF